MNTALKTITCKCIKCNNVQTFDSFKIAWMQGWEFLKETKNKSQDILGVCETCPPLTKEEEIDFRETVA